jgi:4-amino-4-deoxy-L-arabinose transferase-like glycosyltransferase
MAFLKKYYRVILVALLITILYFISRIFSINTLPIFTDEAIYIHWAQVALHDASWRFISLTDGKQPLFIWLTMIAMRFIKDPLIAGRLVSVFAGLFTTLGLYLLSLEVFKNRYIALLSSFLYVIYPFALVYDRMALYDGLVGTFAVWGLYFVILMVKYVRLDVALLLGITTGLGVLNKTNGFFTIYLLPFSVLLFDFNKDKSVKRFLKWFGLSIVVVIFAYGIYSLLRLSPFFYIIAQKDAVFIYPLNEWLKHPFTFFWGNLWIGQRDWFISYFTLPFILLTCISFFLQRAQWREKLILVLWFIIPFTALAMFGRILYPRYIFFMTLSLLPLAAFSIFFLSKKLKKPVYITGFLLAIFLIPIWKDYTVIFNFQNASIPKSDRDQYYNDWPSGIGVKETIQYLKDNEKAKKIALFTQGTFGLMPYAYQIYLYNDKRFIIDGIWPIEDNTPQILLQSAKNLPTYIVFYQPCVNCPAKGKAPLSWALASALEIKKPAKNTSLTLYKVR